MKQSRRYLYVAIGLATLGTTALLVVLSAYAYQLGFRHDEVLSSQSTDWGTFGDFIGGIAGTVIALITLIALAVTIYLQASELEETRAELGKQTAAAREQLADARRYEARRIQPLLEVEWARTKQGTRAACRLINVGLGPCVLERVELAYGEDRLGEYMITEDPNAKELWLAVLRRGLATRLMPPDERTNVKVLNFRRRMMPIGGRHSLVEINFVEPHTAADAIVALKSRIRVIVYFRSLADVGLSTSTQLSAKDSQFA